MQTQEQFEVYVQYLVDYVEEYIAGFKEEGLINRAYPGLSRKTTGKSAVNRLCEVLQERGYRTRFQQRGAHLLIIEWGD